MDFTALSRRADTWLYQQIADILEDAIRSGEIAPGQMLPSGRALAEQAGVSKDAARAAVLEVCARGLAYTVPKLGAFAAKTIPE